MNHPVKRRRRPSQPRSATLLVALLMLSPCLRAPFASANDVLERELRSSLSSLPHKNVGASAFVVDLQTGAPVFEFHADVALVPASNMKVFVMAAALALLGPGFEFQTVLAANGRDLIVIGDGDPAFGDEKLYELRGERITVDFERWADELQRRGVSRVPGDLVIDESVFDDQRLHPSWESADLDNWYAAPVAGLNINDNCVDITVLPATRKNDPVLVTVQPENSLVQIINQCRSRGQGQPILNHRHDTPEYRVTGGCHKRHRFEAVSFPDPGLLFADSFRTVLARRGITIAGTIRRARVRTADGTIPGPLTVLARRSTSLSEVLGRIGKDSQNLFAEAVLKRVGFAWARRHEITPAQGSWRLGGEAVTAVLSYLGIDVNGLVVADGSGLSRENRCTARQLAMTLGQSLRRPGADLFYHSLSVAGVDGSLHKRLKDAPGRVRAKTGTMRGIRTLAGYVEGNAGPRYAFAIMFNGYSGPSAPYKERQDRICRALLQAAAR
jgi:D-alanyl-D-alanine carboxypeptidase/D-alanyl-D-alanine-endopeptidase (penicillin-binding protein 4)